MKIQRSLFRIAVALTLLFAGAGSAYAQATRTWVSGVGDDANPCSRTAPCKTFAGAISKTAASGVINALDPGGFGAVTITKAITIDMGDLTGGILSAGTNGVIVNAGANDEVVLRGISIDGAGTGLNGVRFLGGRSLTLDKCVLENGVGRGLDIQTTSPSATLIVRDTSIRGWKDPSGGGGMWLTPAAGSTLSATFENVTLTRNLFGIQANTRAAVVAKNMTIGNSDSFAVKVIASGGSSSVSLENALVSGNAGAGLFVQGGGAVATLSRSTLFGNGSGMSSSIGGIIQTFGDNHNNGTGTPNSPVTASQ